MRKEQWIVIGGTALAVIALIFLINHVWAFPIVPTPVCGNGEHVGNPHCITPTPSPKNTPTPTATPTPKPCVVWDGEFPKPCPSPTVTPTPSQPPTQGNGGTGVSDGQAPAPQAPAAPTCNIPFDPPALNGFHADGNGAVTFSWLESVGVDKYSIIFGYKPDMLTMGADNIPATSTSFTINGLARGSHVWAIVEAWKNGCMEPSNELDPTVR